MKPQELEDAVRGLVVAEFGKEIRVTAFPDNLESHRMLGEAEILLGYRGGDFDRPQHGSAAQLRAVSFELVVISRSMGGHNGAVETLDRLRLSLQGKKIQGTWPIRIARDAYLGRTAGQWWYSLEIVVPGMMAFPRPAAQDAPRISRITARHNDTNETTEASNGSKQ